MQKATRNQSNSQIWRLQRKGRVTASRFHEVDKKMQVIYRNRLKPVKCKVTPLSLSIAEPKELKNIESIKRGKTNEKYAAENLMKMEGKKHQNPKLLTCGLYSFKPHPYLGATPDNVLKCNCCPKLCVEYKCPHKIRNESIAESWQKCDFLEVVNDRIQLRRRHKYYAQITGQMAITGYNRTYFVVFTTKDIVVEYIEFDKDCWKKMLPNLRVLFKTYVQPYLLGITQIFICPMCDDPCLNSNEFESEEENSI